MMDKNLLALPRHTRGMWAPLPEGISMIPALIASGLGMCHLKQEGSLMDIIDIL